MENKKKNRHSLPCPNCLDNMLQKHSRSIPFMEEGITVFLVQVCEDCLFHPESLDEERMAITLMAERWKWPEPAARKAASAIIEKSRKKARPREPLPVKEILAPTTVAA